MKLFKFWISFSNKKDYEIQEHGKTLPNAYKKLKTEQNLQVVKFALGMKLVSKQMCSATHKTARLDLASINRHQAKCVQREISGVVYTVKVRDTSM